MAGEYFKSTDPDPAIGDEIRDQLADPEVFYEHGQWWVRFGETVWSVHDASPGPFDFELVSEGGP